MINKIHYRKATQYDSAFIAECINTSSNGLASIEWQQIADETDQETALSIGKKIYANDQGGYSYTNCLIAEAQESVGMVLSYPITDENFCHNAKPPPYEDTDLYAPYKYLELKNSWYICGISVVECFRKQGIAYELMQQAILKGQQQGYKQISLIVMVEKIFLVKFYQSLGFYITRQVPIVKHPKLTTTGEAALMVKSI